LSAPRSLFSLAAILLINIVLAISPASSQTLAPTDKPLPFDQGEQGLKQQLRKLQTTGRLLEITAHPDDEDGDVLAMMARGRGYSVTLLTITRGEGGQNRLGSALFDALGVLRTLELLESDKYYGVEQRFTRMADFGFSKSPQESIQKWGHDAALADIVRVIREVQPDVIVAKFAGDERDGHGHHQASAILAREAFRAAGDPKKFPEHFKQGLQPWQAKKFYMRGFSEDHTLSYDTNIVDPVIGETYAKLHLDGLKHQQSQLSGNFNIPSGPRIRYYKLVDSTLPNIKPGTKEKEFFEGIDTSLQSLVPTTAPMRTSLANLQQKAENAVADDNAGQHEKLLGDLQVLDTLRGVYAILLSAPSNPGARGLDPAALPHLRKVIAEQMHAVEEAARDLIGGNVEVKLDGTGQQSRFSSVSPGQSFSATITSAGDGRFSTAALIMPKGWKSDLVTGKRAASDGLADPDATTCEPVDAKCVFRVTVPSDAAITRQHWERDNPETDTRYRVTDAKYTSWPLEPLPVEVHYSYPLVNEVTVYADTSVPLIVVPPIAVTTAAATEVLPSTARDANIGVDVRNTSTTASDATARVKLPPGWNAQPATQTLHLAKADDKQDVSFHVTAPQQKTSGTLHLTALAERNGTAYSDGFEIVTRDDLGAYPYYAPARERISVVDIKIPKGLKVGYVMGAGDDIPTVLKQVGMDVTDIPPADLANADLSKFGTIILGIRAYDTQDSVRKNNPRLLDYVNNGGTLVVQYNSDVNNFNAGHFTPYSFNLSRDRVSMEEQPVEVLAPNDSVFKFPNAISARDFDAWVQERGLYFADTWDDHYQPLLACNDPGEPSRRGGLLRAKYGKGTYIYTGYAFFRQLPAGVPGAVRLFVNLVAAGHESMTATALGPAATNNQPATGQR
jgi:LmbE family N-acetylglucosaminyl deacetylase